MDSFPVITWLLFWSIWGVVVWVDLMTYEAAPLSISIILFLGSGPCVWAVGMWRGIKWLRYWSEKKTGCKCCHH